MESSEIEEVLVAAGEDGSVVVTYGAATVDTEGSKLSIKGTEPNTLVIEKVGSVPFEDISDIRLGIEGALSE